MNKYKLSPRINVLLLATCFCHNSWAAPVAPPSIPSQTEIPVRDIRCDANITFLYVQSGLQGTDVLKPASQVITRFEYVTKSPSKVKVTLKSYSSPELPSTDVFAGNVGMDMILADGNLTISLPNGSTSTVNIHNQVDRQNIALRHGTLNVPFAGDLIADSISLKSINWTKAEQVGTVKKGERILPVREIRFAKPLSPVEPLSISSMRQVIDPSLKVIIEEECRDTHDKVVSKTTFEDFRKNMAGAMYPMISRTENAASRKFFKFPSGQAGGATSLFWSGRLLLKGRQITRKYHLFEEKYPVLDSIEIEDDEGNLVMLAQFTNYHINENIPDSVFETVVSKK